MFEPADLPPTDDTPLVPQAFVLGAAPSAASLWDMRGDDSAAAHEAAIELLSIWAHAQRFREDSLDPSIWQELDALVHREARLLIDAVAASRPLDRFAVECEQVQAMWDEVGPDDGEQSRHLAEAGRSLFQRLDNASLAMVACETLLRETRVGLDVNGLVAHPPLESYRHDVEVAEEFLAENIGVFLPYVAVASWMLAAYRTDLDQNPPLWQTTLKYWRVEELSLALEPPPPQALHIESLPAPVDVISIAAGLVSGFNFSGLVDLKVEDRGVEALVQSLPTAQPGHMSLNIECRVIEGAQQSLDGLVIRATGSARQDVFYCRTDQSGKATFPSVPISTYVLEAWATSVQIDQQEAALMMDLRRPSNDGRFHAWVIEDETRNYVVDVRSAEQNLNGAVIGFVIARANDGRELQTEQEFVLNQSGMFFKGKKRLHPEPARLELAALHGMGPPTLNHVLIYLKRVHLDEKH